MTARQTDLDNLHDAVLETVVFDWKAAQATLSLRVSAATPTRCRIVIEGATSVQCPRQNPWGASVSVNEADLEDDGKRLILHMQSGDDLVFEGASIHLASTPI